MLRLLKLVILGLAAFGGYELWRRYQEATGASATRGRAAPGPGAPGGPPSPETPTGTDPAARYREPGYEDKSFGQAVKSDQELAERLRAQGVTGDEAERRFREEATGAPALSRQEEQRGQG